MNQDQSKKNFGVALFGIICGIIPKAKFGIALPFFFPLLLVFFFFCVSCLVTVLGYFDIEIHVSYYQAPLLVHFYARVVMQYIRAET